MLMFGKPDREYIIQWCQYYNPDVAAYGGYAVHNDIVKFANDISVASGSDDDYLYFFDPDEPLCLTALYKYLHSVSRQSVELADGYFAKLFQVLTDLAVDNADAVRNIIDMFICASNCLGVYELQLRFVELRQNLHFGSDLEML